MKTIESGNEEEEEISSKKPATTATTFVHALMQNAVTNPDDTFVKWTDKSCNVTSSLTYKQLWHNTSLVVDVLKETGVKSGDRVMIAYPFGLEFLSGLIACMRIRAIACSVYPPNFLDKSKAKHSFAQFNRQVEDAGATIALTTRQFKAALLGVSWFGPKTKGVKWVPTDKIESNKRKLSPSSSSSTSLDIKPEDIAFIQYSSGSTGDPKGVTIRHNALAHHLGCLSSEIKYEPGSVVVMWMPQYHDFALIAGFMLSCFFTGSVLVMCSPLDFIRSPLLWVDMIEKFKATHTGGPNFSYGLLAKRMKAAERKLKATSLIQASVGAEPIAPDTLLKMQEIGIDSSIIAAGYGMAEACVRVSNAVGDEIRIVDGVVSSGYLPRNERYGMRVKIVSESGDIVNDGEVGEIHLHGPDISLGYWNKPDLESRFKVKLSDGNEYFSTGDLGRIVDDRLYVVGRTKELIIVNGRNIYPTDIERVVEREYHEIVRPGSSVAFQSSDTEIGLIVEIRKGVATSKDSMPASFSSTALKRLVLSSCDADVSLILAVKQGAVPKTTSGKLKRVEARRRCMEDNWGVNDVLLRHMTMMGEETDLQAQSKRPTENTRSGEKDPKPRHGIVRGNEVNAAEVLSLFRQVLGKDFDTNDSWEAIGLSSLAQAELSGAVETEFRMKLPFNYTEKFKTPSELIDFIVARSGRIFQVGLTDLQTDSGRSLPKVATILIQGVLVCTFILILMTAVASSIAVNQYFTSFAGNTSYYIVFGNLPVTLPTFILSLSVIVIVLKWLVVGRYQERQIEVYSTAYLRWWYMDRLVHLWEMWVGVLIVETPVIWIFYRLLGSRIHPRTRISAFIREFDLVTIGSEASIKFPIRCRRFGPWTDKGGPSLRFRQVKIGSGCLVEGMVSLGSKVGDKVHVDKMSVLAEGARVGAQIRAVGNLAYDDGKTDVVTDACYTLVGLQMLWLLFDLHLFSCLLVMCGVIWSGQLYSAWRYSTLCYILLSLLSTSFLSLHVSAVLKWLMIGGRKGTGGSLKPSSLWVLFSDWACDYHFQTSHSLFYLAAGLSRVWNVMLMLHGLDIDLQSFMFDSSCFRPSMMNQVVVRRAYFASVVSIRSGDTIEVMDSTIGYRATLSAGIKVHRSTVGPYGDVEESTYDNNFHPMKLSVCDLILDEIGSMFFFLTLCVSFVPSYEVFIGALSLLGESNILTNILGAVLAFAVWCMTWFILRLLSQPIAVFLMKHRESLMFPHLADVCYRNYIQINWFTNNYWGHWFLLWGTPLYNIVAQMMGAIIEGDLLFNGRTMHDTHSLSFQDKTVVDESQIMAHISIGTRLSIERSSHSGVLHQYSFTLAGTQCDGLQTTEYGPLRPIFGQKSKELDV